MCRCQGEITLSISGMELYCTLQQKYTAVVTSVTVELPIRPSLFLLLRGAVAKLGAGGAPQGRRGDLLNVQQSHRRAGKGGWGVRFGL